jgi:hypothetical protein
VSNGFAARLWCSARDLQSGHFGDDAGEHRTFSWSGEVVLVGDNLAPLRLSTGHVRCPHGQVAHEVVRWRAMSMPFTRRYVDGVPGSGGDDATVACFQSDSLRLVSCEISYADDRREKLQWSTSWCLLGAAGTETGRLSRPPRPSSDLRTEG